MVASTSSGSEAGVLGIHGVVGVLGTVSVKLQSLPSMVALGPHRCRRPRDLELITIAGLLRLAHHPPSTILWWASSTPTRGRSPVRLPGTPHLPPTHTPSGHFKKIY